MEEGIAPPSRRLWGVVAGVVARRRGARVGGEEPSRSITAEGPVAVRTVTVVVFRHRRHVVTPSSPPEGSSAAATSMAAIICCMCERREEP
ncbi:hypothetical protein AHAS_Ahas17G0181000 [Arachis hypogaea]